MRPQTEAGTFLALLTDADRLELDALGRRVRFPRRTRLMHEGEPGERVMILLEGHVKASAVTPEGHELVLSFRGPGDVLGELSFLDAQARSSSVTAIEPVAPLPGREPQADPVRRLHTVGRVAARLVELAERYGEPADGGIRVGLPITQEELGSWTSSSRAGVAKALQTMRELGWIETDRRRIVIRELEALTGRAA